MSFNDYLDGAILFESERLICRRWLASDIETIFEVYSDPEVARWIDDGSPIKEEESRTWLGVTGRNYLNRGYGMFALQDKESSDVAGFVGLVHPANQIDAEIKYAFYQKFWGRGLASEVVKATVSYGVKAHGLTKIVATVAPENKASQRVLEKARFAFVEERICDDETPEFYYEWHAGAQQ